MKDRKTTTRKKDDRNRDLMRRWLDGLCRGEGEERRVTVHSEPFKENLSLQPFKENLSYTNRPIRIAGRVFEGGLSILTNGSAEQSTHRSVEIRSTVPMTRFRAMVGLDDNSSVRKMAGVTVVFSIEAGGRELWRSSPMVPADAAQAVDVALDGVCCLVLKAGAGSDSAYHWTHADYADAVVELADSSVHTVARTLDEQRLEAAIRPPLSFRLGGRSSEEFFKTCRHEASVTEVEGGGRVGIVRYRDDVSGVTCRIEARQFCDFPVVEWIARFTNDADRESPLLEDVRALDMAWPAPAPARLHCARGSNEQPDDFQPVIEELGTIRSDLRTVRLDAGSDGRSSVPWLPFMNLETAGEGLVLAIGWSGQWSAEIGREAGTGAMRLRAGMDGVHLRLHPGESIRTPRILLLYWQGEPIDGNNLLRRYITAHCAPLCDGRPVEAPACFPTWGGMPTPKHLTFIKRLGEQGIKYDCYWVDAGWYGTSATPCPDVFNGDWWKVGDWRVNRHYHEHGLKPLSDAVHAAGMKFLLWIEIERAMHGMPVTLEHPEWFLSKTDDPRKENDHLLLDLGRPEARAWAIETVAGLVETEGVDWYRQDFNMEPMEYWRTHDEPERRGMTQIRHIEGLYAFWDELRRRFPHLIIDNCASGGRRIDFETLSRSIPLWRSDYGCFAEAEADGLQVHAAGIACWVPISTGGGIYPPGDTYFFRSNLSAALAEVGICPDAAAIDKFIAGTDNFPWEWYRRMLADYYRARPLFAGDFYPLTSITLLPDAWLACQLHRPDLGRGFVLAFRRSQSPHSTAVFPLKGLVPGKTWRFEDADSGQCRDVKSGKLLKTGLKVSLPETRSCCLLFYETKVVSKNR